MVSFYGLGGGRRDPASSSLVEDQFQLKTPKSKKKLIDFRIKTDHMQH